MKRKVAVVTLSQILPLTFQSIHSAMTIWRTIAMCLRQGPSLHGKPEAVVDPGFWSGGPAEVWPQGALSPKFAKNRGFFLHIFWKLHDFEKILGPPWILWWEGLWAHPTNLPDAEVHVHCKLVLSKILGKCPTIPIPKAIKQRQNCTILWDSIWKIPNYKRDMAKTWCIS